MLGAQPGLEVRIVVDQQPLVEHVDATHRQPTTLRCAFVQVSEGSTFVVQVTTEDQFTPPSSQVQLGVSVYLDGAWIDKQRMLPPRKTIEFQGKRGSGSLATWLERFTFARLSTVDDCVETVTPEMVKHLGEIKVNCHWVRTRTEMRQATHATEITAPANPTKNFDIPEKALKGRAISTRATLDAPETNRRQSPSSHANTTTIWEYPYGKLPFATFIFKYRSKRDLQIEGIIERTPSPPPLEERNAADLSLDEAQELIRRMRARETSLVTVKQEFAKRVLPDEEEGTNTDSANIPPRRKRVRRTNDIANPIIDLTDQ